MGDELSLKGECGGRQCSYNITKSAIGCTSGDGSCFAALLLTAEESDFHDKTLAAATLAIKKILDGIGADPQGRKLSFVKTNMGILLAWVEHGKPVPSGAVTSADDDYKIAAALRLKGIATAQTSQTTD